MKRWRPHLLMFVLLLVVWLLLQQSLAPGTILLGVLLAAGLSWVFGKLQPPALRLRHGGTLLLLLARVLADIIRSNIRVARIIVLARGRFVSGFVRIPLEITSPYALALLACIITSTPGTIWVRHDSSRRVLVIHVLDLLDENTWIANIKQRYERPLLRIFQ